MRGSRGKGEGEVHGESRDEGRSGAGREEMGLEGLKGANVTVYFH